MIDQETYDKSRPQFPPNHFQLVLSQVKNRENYLDLGMETGQTFFQLYHEFSGDIVGIDASNLRVEFVRQKAQKIMPTSAMNRAKLIDGDMFKVGSSLNKHFDLVTVGSQMTNFGSPDRFFDFVKEKLLSEDGTLSLTSLVPKQIEFYHCYDDKEDASLKKDFANLQDMLSEYQILPNNPVFNQGIQDRHFSKIHKKELEITNIMESEHLVQFLRTMPSYIKYIQDPYQVDKYALNTFERKLREKIMKRIPIISSNQSLIKITHKVLTFLLRK